MARLNLIDDGNLLREVSVSGISQGDSTVRQPPVGLQDVGPFRGEPVDLVVADLIMPNRAGIESRVALRRASAWPSLIARSGGPAHTVEEALAEGRRSRPTP